MFDSKIRIADYDPELSAAIAAEGQRQEQAQRRREEEARKKQEEEERVREARQREQEAARLADEVASIINNEDSRGATTGAGGTPTLGKETGQAARLSQSQIDGLVARIKSCILMPAGAEEAGATAELQFSIGSDGSIVGQPQRLSTATSQIEETYARAVQRAVQKCAPYTVVAGQEVRAHFRAREF